MVEFLEFVVDDCKPDLFEDPRELLEPAEPLDKLEPDNLELPKASSSAELETPVLSRLPEIPKSFELESPELSALPELETQEVVNKPETSLSSDTELASSERPLSSKFELLKLDESTV